MDPATAIMLAQLLMAGLQAGGVIDSGGGGGGGGFGGIGGMGGGGGMGMLSGLFGGGQKKKPRFQGYVPPPGVQPQGQGQGGDPMMATLLRMLMLQGGGRSPGAGPVI